MGIRNDIWSVMKLPSVAMMTTLGIILFSYLFGFGSLPESIIGGMSGFVVGIIYVKTLDNLLLENQDVPETITMILIPAYMMIPVYLHPKTELAQLSLYPLALFIFGYTIRKRNEYHPIEIVAFGTFMVFSVGTFLRTGVYLENIGYLSGAVSYSALAVVVLFWISGHIIQIFGLYRGALAVWRARSTG